MFAINHAATALIIKKAYPDAPIAVLLVSVQLVEIFWVILNIIGIERTTTEDKIESVSDVHPYMPFSHSIASTITLAFVAWAVIALGFRESALGAAAVIGIVSHLVLDLVSHARDIAIAPFIRSTKKLGVGLYEKPVPAFVLEMGYGFFCWWIYEGSRALLWIIVLFNLANASFFLKAIPGPEKFLAHKPIWITAVVALQIIVTAFLVGIFS